MVTSRWGFVEPDASTADPTAALILLANQVELLGNWARSRTNTPPGTPDDGDIHIIGTAPTGVWTGHANEVARYRSAGWTFYSPRPGWGFRVENEANAKYVWRSNGPWAVLSGSGSGLTSVAADPSPRLAADLDCDGHALKRSVIAYAKVTGGTTGAFNLSTYAEFSGNGLKMENTLGTVAEMVCTLDTFAWPDGANFLVSTRNSKRLRLVPGSPSITTLRGRTGDTRVSASGLATLALTNITLSGAGVPTAIEWSLGGDTEP